MSTPAPIVESNEIVTTDLVVDHRTDHGPIRALEADGFTICAGTSVAIMGPSGCGKSTLLGLLAGLAVPTAGAVTIGATTISALNERDRVRFRRARVGMVYQADNLLPHLTVEENVGLQLSIVGGAAEGATQSALLDRLGIGGLSDRLPDQLSGGQRQRVAIARAVVHRPSVILADEPTGALDDANATAVIELLVDVQRQIGAALVVVTHDPAIGAHADRLIRLRRPAAS